MQHEEVAPISVGGLNELETSAGLILGRSDESFRHVFGRLT